MNEADRHRIERIANAQPPFGTLLGVRITSAAPDRVEGEFTVTEELGNRNAVLHGGALMGFADNLGGTASFLNLDEDETSTTLESKTNFIRSVPVGDTVRGVCVPLHVGRTTMVWQTMLSRGDGKRVAVVTQTQMRVPRSR